MTTETASTALLDEATRIGEMLCRTAFWHDHRCTWAGRSILEASAIGMPIIPTTATLDGDLYAGTAGVALFLAQLHAQRPAARFRDTALGALRHAMRRELPGASPLSVFSGALGVAWVLCRVGQIVAAPELTEEGLARLSRLKTVDSDEQPLDVVSGVAGAILALLSLTAIPGHAHRVAWSATMAKTIARRAVRYGDSWAWTGEDAMRMPMPRPLTGFAHGASGIGLALLAVAHEVGDSALLEGGKAAFAYEDGCFDARQGNWPDHRSAVTAEVVAGEMLPCGHAWCHGAAGLGLARARAVQLTPSLERTQAWAIEIAARTTMRCLDTVAARENADCTPCHGLAGLADCLLEARNVVPGTVARVRSLWAEQLARRQGDDHWPSGAPSGGPNPSLMLGDAGVGHALLRAYDPALPSLLLLM